jgi:1-deoxy-D-xylulose-5-phosphate synthase
MENSTLIPKLKSMNRRQCKAFCKKLRRTIIKETTKNGGHLAANLGTVELTAALYRVFDFPDDKLVWDVGHQAYAAKLITGRSLKNLRKEGGVSGFCRPHESEYDPVVTGHSSSSVSAAIGLAEAMTIKGDNHAAVTVIGDGAFTGGLCYEGLNNAAGKNLIVILNQNDMSIGKNVGTFAKYLSTIRINDKYLRLKQRVKKALSGLPVIGAPIASLMLKTKDVLKSVLYNSTMFEQFGFAYIGPVDGHNIAELEEALTAAKAIAGGTLRNPCRPVFVHVNTKKGKGYKPAEKNPGAYHSVPAGHNRKHTPEVDCESYSCQIGKHLSELAAKDGSIVAITAAMKYAVGLSDFAERFPERFFDVGIAEAHAVTFAGGLAAEGCTPVFCVYSSFLQRAYDQIIEDIAIAGLHAVFCVDRAGFVGEDGETHQGHFDIPMLTSIPGVILYAPSSIAEARYRLEKAIPAEGIVAIRYPRGSDTAAPGKETFDESAYTLTRLTKKGSVPGHECLAVGYGRQFGYVAEARKTAGGFDMLKLNRIFPVSLPAQIYSYKYIVVFEESARSGGIGEHIAAALAAHGYAGKLRIVAAEGFVPQATVETQLKNHKLDTDGVTKIMKEVAKTLKKPVKSTAPDKENTENYAT